MAQWVGMYSWNSHATRVEDLEMSLHHAMKIYREALPAEADAKKTIALRLAKQLLKARLKLVRSRIVQAKDNCAESFRAKRQKEIDSLEKKEEILRESGLDMILQEFGLCSDEDLIRVKEL